MATELEVQNQALYRCGAEPIASASDDVERARVVASSWPFVREEVLRSHSWNCTTERVVLTPSVTAPVWGYATAYDLPADCLRVMEADTAYEWRVEGRQVVTQGSGDLNIRYQKDLAPDDWDASLTIAVVLRLAAEIVERVTDSTTKREALIAEYDAWIRQARQADAQEQSEIEFVEDSFITARY